MSELRDVIRRELTDAGACAVGFASAGMVDDAAWDAYMSWLDSGSAGELGYMHRNLELRRDPRGLLEGCSTLVCTAWNYLPAVLRGRDMPYIARYAYPPDYHKALRRILKPLCRSWQERFSGLSTRICIDSAPLMERYWAVRSGVGFIGRNGVLIVPGTGSWVFLAEILLTAVLEPDIPCGLGCAGCGVCRSLCPSGALDEDGRVDCRRCLSALTVEVPGSAPKLPQTPLAGCDCCQSGCPHNAGALPTEVPQLAAMPQVAGLSADEILAMDDEDFRGRFAGSALSRMGLEGLRANLSRL